MKLDEKGRCCGKKPIHYKGGAWNSPARPLKLCTRCHREFDPDTEEQRANMHWQLCCDCGAWTSGYFPEMSNGQRPKALCAECACEDDCAPD